MATCSHFKPNIISSEYVVIMLVNDFDKNNLFQPQRYTYSL